MAISFDPSTGAYSDPESGVTLEKEGGVYEISSLDQLKLFRDAVNAGNSFHGETVKLTTSIDLDNEEWTPIGKSGAVFQGTFDGAGKTISNLKITKELDNTSANCGVGLFGYTNAPAKITNLTIDNVDITGSLYVGAIVGYGFTGAEISNCHVTGRIEIEGWWYIGGIGGNGYVSKVDNCTVSGEDGSYIKALNDGSYVGGIWGYRGEGNVTISDCSVDNIDITGYDRTGGICGIAHYQNTIQGCSITNSSITAAGNAGNIGLIAGANLGRLTTDKGAPAGPTILLNNTVDETTRTSFTLEGGLVSDPPILGENDHEGNAGKAAIIGDVTLNDAGEITGGTISVVGTEQSAIDVNSKLDFAEGFQAYPTGEGTLEVDVTGYVASVNGVRYESLSEAIAMAGAGDTITLLDNVTLSSKLNLSQSQVFELNGFTLDGAIALSGDADVTFQNGTMTAAYNSTTSNEYSVILVNDSAKLTLDTVTLEGEGTLDKSQSTRGIYYKSQGVLNVINSTVYGGTLTAKNGSGSDGHGAEAIYAMRSSAGTISIIKSELTGGAGITNAEFSGKYQAGLYPSGGIALQLGGTAEVIISESTISGGNSDWKDAEDAINVSNSFFGTLNISEGSRIKGGDALNLSGETSRGIGGNAIYTHSSTGCTEIVVTDSELKGGNGDHGWDGSALELNTGTPEVTITNSTLTVGQGVNSSGNAGAIRVNQTNTIQVNLDGVTLNGDGDGNHVFQITSNVTNGGISLAGETTISGGTLEDVEFVEVAEGTTIKTTGTGAVDTVTVTSPAVTPVYDETTGAYVFEPVVQALDTVLVNSNWSGQPAGSVVQYGDEYYRLGTNAFGNTVEAIAGFGSSVTANQDTAEIIFASDNESGESGTKYYLYTDTDLALTTDGTPRTVTINGSRLYLMNVYALDSEFKPIPNPDLPTVTIGEGLTLITEGLLNVGQNVDQTDVEDGQPTRDAAAMSLVVDGTLVTRLYVASNSEVVVSETGRILMGAKEAFITRTGSKMTVNGDGSKDDVQFEVNYTSMQGGVLTLKDTWMKSGVVWLSTSEQGFVNESSTLILNNSRLESSSNGAIQSGSTISAANGSEITFAGVMENAGAITLDASSFTAKELANTGTFQVSGTSTLNIGTLTGEVELLDGAVLTDSRVGGKVTTEGDVTIAGTTTLGQLVLEGARGDDRTIVIDKNATVSLGHLDVGIGLQKPDLVPGDTAERVYDGHVLVEGALSVDKANQSGAIYIRPYAELVVTGTLDVKGEVHNRGSLVVDGGTMTMTDWLTPKLLGYDPTGDRLTITNHGTMTVAGAGAVTFGEASASVQHIDAEPQYADGMFATISEGGRFLADTLAFANDDDVTLRVTGAGSLFKLYSADGREATNAYNYAQNEGTIIVEDQAVFNVSELANTNFANSGSLELAGGSASFATLTNSGTVDLDNGTLSSVGAVDNSGTMNFANAVDANTITNSGVVNFKGDAEFQGEITGSGDVQYMGEGNELTGDVSAKKFIVGLEGDDAIATSLEISGGATVNVTGGGNSGRIGVNTDVVITGEGTTFTDKANLTMDESATLEISNGAEVNIGYLATGGKTDVTGATLNLTGGDGTAGASAIGGLHDATEFNVNAGGVVNALNGLVIGHRETKDGLVNVNAGGELHVSGGALKVSGLVGNYDVQGNGTLNVNGGTVTADNGGDNGLIVGDAWDGASGILKVTNGGSITAGYSIQLNSTSRVTIDGGSMSAQQMYQSEGGELSIVNGGSVTLTNAYFAMGGKITVGDAESGKISRLETVSSGETGPASLGGDYGTHAGETVLNIEENGEVVLGTGLIVGHRADSTVSKDATVNVNAGGKLELANQLQLGSTGEYQAAGTVNVLGGTVDASAAEVTINSRGVLKVEDGAFSAGTVTNNGAVSITGESTVVAKFNAAGTGSVEIAGATLGAGSGINRLESSDVASQFGSNITLKDTVTVTDGAWLGTGWTGSLTMGFGTGDSGVLNITDGAVVSVGGPLYFGSEEAALDDGIFELNISGAGSLLQSHGASGEYYITGDAVVTVTDGGALTNPGRVRSGATYVFGAVGDTNAATVEFRRTELVETAQVTIQGGAVADLGELVFGDDQMAYDGSFTLAADSQLKLDSYSSFRGVGEITVTGVDADQTAIRKLIDYTGSGSIDYTTVIANWDEIAELVTVINNDLYLGSADMSMLKVNSAWLNLEPGTEVETGFFYGFNAFDNMNQAVSALDRSYVLGDTFGTPVTVELTDATSGALDLYGLNLELTGNLTSSGSWNTALVSSPSSDPNYISYLKLDNAQIELTGNAALEGVNWGKAAVSFNKEGNIVASAGQDVQRGAIVELVKGSVFDADNQINGRGVFFKLDGTSRIYQHGSGNSLITMTSGAIIDGGVAEAGTYNQLNQLDALWVYFGKGSGEWAGIYGDKAYFTFRNGANIEAGNRIEFGTGSLLKELDVEIDSSRVASVGNIIIGTEGNAGKITSFTVADHSLLEAGTDLSIVGTTVALSDSTLNAATVTFGADAVLTVSGASAVDAEFAADGAGLVSFNDVTLDAATRINETASYEVNTVGSEIELTGTNLLTDGAFVSTGWAKNLRIGFDTAADQARVEVTDGATLRVGGAAYLGSNAEDRGAGAFAVAVSGAGSSFAGAGADGSLYVRADGLLTVTDQAAASFSYLQNKGAIEISNAAFSANDLVITATGSVSVSDQSAFAVSGEITLAGQLTTDYRTTLAFGGLIDAGGTLTIDMNGYTDGIYKLMDYTGTGSFSQGDYIALLGSENYRSDYAVINGDLYVINAPELKINAAWEGTAFAQEVESGFYYGLNAFGNLDEVYQKISEPGVSKITMASDVTMTDPSQVSGEMWFKFHDDVTIDSDVAGEQRVINISGAELMLTSRDQSRGNGGEQVSITLGEDLKIQTDSTIWFGYIFDDALQYPTYAGDFSADIVLAGEVNMTGGQAHLFGYSSTMTITETGSLTVAQSDIQTRGSQLTVNGNGKEMAQAQVQLNHERSISAATTMRKRRPLGP